MQKLIILLVTAISLHSCSCNWHLKKARNKCGYTSDTIFKTVEVTVPKIETDTVFKEYFTQRDTVIVREGRLTMKYYYNTHDSTVYLSGKCDTVKVPVKVPVVVNKYKMSLPWWVTALKWLLIIIGIGVGFIIGWSKLKPKVVAVVKESEK